LQDLANPTNLALRVFYQQAYGESHSYGYTELGTEESLKKITHDDVEQFWAAGYVPSNTVLAITGDITQAEARALAEKYFGAWKGTSGASVTTPGFPKPLKRKIVIADKPGAPQTALLVGGIGVPRSSPDYVPMEVMNNILGGLISARLNTNLREKHGYTYAAFSQFVYRRGPGPFFARTSVRADVTGPAVQELFNELNRISTDTLSPEELMGAKDAMARSLPGLFETTQQTSRSIADLFIYNLPLDYFSALPAKINAVTAADVQRVAKKYIQPESMIVVAVGDRSKIEPEITKLNLGEIEVIHK
jgi:zinc protease